MQILWVLDHLPDLESDFSAIHRIEDMYSLPSARFFQFANRLSCYQGVIKTLAEIERQQNEPSGSRGGESMANVNEIVESDPASLQMNFGDFMDTAEI